MTCEVGSGLVGLALAMPKGQQAQLGVELGAIVLAQTKRMAEIKVKKPQKERSPERDRKISRADTSF